MIYSVNKKGATSGRKIANAISHYKQLQKKITIEGETLWIKNALKIVLAKFKKYSVNII